MSGSAYWFGGGGHAPLEQIGQLRERFGRLIQASAAPGAAETAAAATSPFRYVAGLLLPVLSEYGGVILERLQGLRAPAASAREAAPVARRSWVPRLRPIVITSAALLAAAFIYGRMSAQGSFQGIRRR